MRDDVIVTRIDDRGPPVRLDEGTLGRLREALRREPVLAAYLFGSQAAARAGPLSDVDVAVWVRPDAVRDGDRLAPQLELMAAASRAVGSDEVDVLILNDAPPLLRHRALRGAVLLVDRDPRARVRLEARALLDYLDTQYLREELARGLRKRLREDAFGRP